MSEEHKQELHLNTFQKIKVQNLHKLMKKKKEEI